MPDTKERVTRELWATWNLIAVPYGAKETIYGTIPRHLAARQWPGQDVSMYRERPDSTYPTGQTDKPDGRWRWTLTGEPVIPGVPGPIATGGAIATRADLSQQPIATRLSCPVCRGPIAQEPGHRQRVYCSPACKRVQQRAARD